MASKSPNHQQNPPARFSESVRLSLLGIGLLGLVLGVTAGVLTGVTIRNLVGDDPIISGSEAAVFYVTFAAAVVIDLFLLLNFTSLSVKVTEHAFEFRYGMFGKSLKWDQIKSVESTDYKWISYGGWGIRFSTKGRRAWSQIGAKRGVVVEVIEGSNERRYFVSSNRADELSDAIRQAIGSPKTEPVTLTEEGPDSTQ